MRWANFLHIYQPIDQQPDILEAIVAQSYRPILANIVKNKKIRLTMNINGSLLELFDKYGYRDLIDMLREMGKDGRIEFTGSAKYHAFLPFISLQEAERQIKINDETNSFFLGESYKPKGFFPPEMAYDDKLSKVIENAGFKWVILDEIALKGEPGLVDYNKTYKIKGTNLDVFFRERRLSNLIMSAVVRSPETLREAMKDDLKSKRYVITAMDGETFGHHRPGLEKTLFDVFNTPGFDLINISEISKYYKHTAEIEPVKSTWASTREDVEKGIQFLSWSDPDNTIHFWQKELLDLTLKAVYSMEKSDPDYERVRRNMDIAMFTLQQKHSGSN